MGGLRKQRFGSNGGRRISAPKRETGLTALRPEGPKGEEDKVSQSIRAGDVNDLSFINPKGLYDPAPSGYSHLAVFPAGWRMILPAGQGGETEDQVLSDDFRTQLKQAVRNTEIVLAAAGANLSDVAKFTLYVVDHDKEKFRIIQEEFGPVWGDRKPAWTLAPVPALALEGMLVEIDVIAVLPR
jgi:enamine deaminase RidA (YjgF/YER057c/UK114 family)